MTPLCEVKRSSIVGTEGMWRQQILAPGELNNMPSVRSRHLCEGFFLPSPPAVLILFFKSLTSSCWFSLSNSGFFLLILCNIYQAPARCRKSCQRLWGKWWKAPHPCPARALRSSLATGTYTDTLQADGEKFNNRERNTDDNREESIILSGWKWRL